MDDSQVDEAILSVTETSWRKVALVIIRAQETLGDNPPQDLIARRVEAIFQDELPRQVDTGIDPITQRIEALVQDGRLLAQGDIKNWRFSEIRKPG
jgi:hypothetical protein